MKILILASQHGNEHLGEKLYAYLQAHHPELEKHVEYLLANPEARRRNVRYIESDLNRSYNGQTNTHEERQAQEILKHVNSSDYDLVLDLHTTVCDQPPSLIVASINPRNERFIKASSIPHVVIMEPQTVSTALTGIYPQSVAIEINRDISDGILEELCADIQRYLDDKACTDDKHIYEAELLTKAELSISELVGLRNFELSEQGFYPILVGESSYQNQGYDYLGFKAYKRRIFKL